MSFQSQQSFPIRKLPSIADRNPLSHHSKAIQKNSTCNRCASWCNPEKWTSGSWTLFEDTTTQLASSKCELCQFLRMIMIGHQQRSRYRLPLPYMKHTMVSTCGQRSSLLSLVYELPTGYQRYAIAMKCLPSSGERLLVSQPSYISYEKIKTWITQCRTHDPYALASVQRVEGLKVIRCNARPPMILSAPNPCRYVALSYVWGDSKEASFEEGDSIFGNIPPTIEDSIKVAAELGYEYLWIDRYVRKHALLIASS